MPNKKLTDLDICRAAKKLKCDTSAVEAVAQVESAGNGFYLDGFPVILFERHLFRKFTQGRYNKDYPELSGNPGNYGAAGFHQRDKFNKAFALNPDAAMKSCSWGKFQILGSNYEVCGFDNVGAFVDAMKESEGKQLDAFVNFVIGNNLAKHLREHHWANFANGYNGKNYHIKNYDVKLGNAWFKFNQSPIDCQTSAAPPSVTSDIPTLEQRDLNQVSATPAPPNDKVAVEREEPEPSFFAKVKLKVGGWVAYFGGTEVVHQWKADLDAWGLAIPVAIIKYALILGAGAFLIWLLYEAAEHFVKPILKRKLTTALIAGASTPTNVVQMVSPENIESLEKDGWTIVRRK